MTKSGGIIALVAGIFAVLAALFTIMVGGIGSAFESDAGSTVTNLGFLGLLGAFGTIVMGAVGMNAKTKKAGYITIGLSLASAIFGGTFVAFFMILAFIGGILMVVGVKKNNI
jgi:hypothetical protein